MAIIVNIADTGECGKTALGELLGLSDERIKELQIEADEKIDALYDGKGSITSSDVINIAASISNTNEEYTMSLLGLYLGTFRKATTQEEVDSES